MSNEELMRTRFLVTELYPGTSFSIGDIITMDSDSAKEIGFITYSAYPHLFRKLNWWQRRTEQDMPEYIKTDPNWQPKYKKDIKIKGEVVKPFKILQDDYAPCWFKEEKDVAKWDMYNLAIYVPATKEEHEEYQLTKKTKPLP